MPKSLILVVISVLVYSESGCTAEVLLSQGGVAALERRMLRPQFTFRK